MEAVTNVFGKTLETLLNELVKEIYASIRARLFSGLRVLKIPMVVRFIVSGRGVSKIDNEVAFMVLKSLEEEGYTVKEVTEEEFSKLENTLKNLWQIIDSMPGRVVRIEKGSAAWLTTLSTETYCDFLASDVLKDVQDMEDAMLEGIECDNDITIYIEYNVIPVTKEALDETYEVLGRIYETVGESLGEVRSVTKVYIPTRNLPEKIKDIRGSIYYLEDHFVVILYSVFDLKKFMELIKKL